jgi:hypothetical protein
MQIFIILLILSSMYTRDDSCMELPSDTDFGSCNVNFNTLVGGPKVTGKQIISFQDNGQDHITPLYIDFEGVSHFTLTPTLTPSNKREYLWDTTEKVKGPFRLTIQSMYRNYTHELVVDNGADIWGINK